MAEDTNQEEVTQPTNLYATKEQLKERQVYVRTWANTLFFNPPWITVCLDEDFSSRDIKRWVMMQLRTAINNNFACLKSNQRWHELYEHLQYNPLALIKKWDEERIADLSNNFKTRYHIILETEKQPNDPPGFIPLWFAAPSKINIEFLSVTSEQIFDFLGYTGGLVKQSDIT